MKRTTEIRYIYSRNLVYDIPYIPLERKCTREDPSVGGNVMMPMPDPLFSVTAYAWVLTGTFSHQEDMIQAISSYFHWRPNNFLLFRFINFALLRHLVRHPKIFSDGSPLIKPVLLKHFWKKSISHGENPTLNGKRHTISVRLVFLTLINLQ